MLRKLHPKYGLSSAALASAKATRDSNRELVEVGKKWVFDFNKCGVR